MKIKDTRACSPFGALPPFPTERKSARARSILLPLLSRGANHLDKWLKGVSVRRYYSAAVRHTDAESPFSAGGPAYSVVTNHRKCREGGNPRMED